MWGPPGTFSLDCLESPTLETYASGGSLSSSVVLCRPDMELGGGGGEGVWLRCLRAIPLEVPLLSTIIASPSLFTWAPLGIFLRLFKNIFHSHGEGFRLFLCLFFAFLFFFFHISYHNRLSEPVVTEYLKTDLVHTPVLIAYRGYLEPTE